MHKHKLESLIEALLKTTNENERQQLVTSLVEEINLITKQLEANAKKSSASDKKIAKSKAKKVVDSVSIVLIKLLEHKIYSDILEYVHKVLGL